MRLILVDRSSEVRDRFRPVCLGRPIWELRCGFTSLGEKLIARIGADDVACFVPDYMAEAYAETTARPVNDPSVLSGEDLLLVDPCLKAEAFDVPARGPSEVGVDAAGRVLYARVTKADAATLPADGVDDFLAAAKEKLPNAPTDLPTWQYAWDLVLANAGQIAADFAAAGRSGVEGAVEEPRALRGSEKDVYVAPGAVVHPMVVIDAEHGPVYIDRDAVVHPFTRIEGPCYLGPGSILLGAKCREGNSIGPMCRIGGEVEESIVHGHSNKYHDGFLGHAYVGEWVNLGAGTTNSDLKNDYSTVSVMMGPGQTIDTGSTKVGALIGDHVKTSIGTLLNTGSYVGAMALIMATGEPLPKYIPSFAWFINGVVTKGFGRRKLYETAETVMTRRGRQWTEAQQAMWDAVFGATAPARDLLIQRGRRRMLRG
ncbi:MAG TPA: putative sugar nucleotidyl transferase [Phycisphaerae bacterium]|nr:putative sugar nucleotidyl transferase [Phycisphaerae bacterium]